MITVESSFSTQATNEEIFDPLNKIQIPEDKINELILNQHTWPPYILVKNFMEITQEITSWLEAAHMIAFTIEQNIKKEDMESYSVQPLENSTAKIQPLIQLLSECCDDQDDIHTNPKCKIALTKIQSECSGLQHFIHSVKILIDNANDKYMLRSLMENILLQIDDLSIMIFQFQEKRHLNAAKPSYVSEDTLKKDDGILIEIDNRVGPLFNLVEKAYTRMTAIPPPEDNSGLLTRKHLLVQERWESLRLEIDELKAELKEDRWLVVFKQVADQVDDMMNGLEKTVTQCYHTINQIKEGSGHHFMTSSSSTTSNSSSSSATLNTNSNPIDLRSKLRSVEKNFEAKYKYYTPSIAKMLTMLGNGIASRVTRNGATLQRHEAMLTRWSKLKITMDQLRKRDLSDVIEANMGTEANCWSRMSDRSDSTSGSNTWTTRLQNGKPSSPSFSSAMEDNFMEFGVTSSSLVRSKSPYNNYQRFTATSPSPLFMEEKGRKIDHPLWRGSSPINNNNNNNGRRTTSPSFYARDNFSSVSSILRPNSISPSSSRQTTQYVSKSPELGTNYEEHDMMNPTREPPQDSPLRPIRRTGTPSMIPRPKTPTVSKHVEPARPRSSMARIRNITSPTHRAPVSYRPDSRDPLDLEVAQIVNKSPIPIQCSKKEGGNGKYYFGNELNPSLGGGKKIYTCKLMTYENSGKNKVLIRVGGGWQDLEIFLLEHMNLIG